jgi:hypothetical protein
LNLGLCTCKEEALQLQLHLQSTFPYLFFIFPYLFFYWAGGPLWHLKNFLNSVSNISYLNWLSTSFFFIPPLLKYFQSSHFSPYIHSICTISSSYVLFPPFHLLLVPTHPDRTCSLSYSPFLKIWLFWRWGLSQARLEPWCSLSQPPK